MIAGPTITTNIAGSTNSTSGKRILIVVLCAASSARKRRRVRKRVGAGVQRRCDLRAELFALDQRRGERLDVLDRGALGQIAQRLTERGTRRNFRGHQRQLAANFLLLTLAFGADDLDRLEQSQARFDADDQQVEDVGKLPRDRVLALAGAPSDVDTLEAKIPIPKPAIPKSIIEPGLPTINADQAPSRRPDRPIAANRKT